MMPRYFSINDDIPLPTRYRCFRKRKLRYINLANAFDIEVTSFRECEEYRATMYIWQASIDGVIIIGRTWDEFKTFINILEDHFNLYSEKILVIYVHNLAYEFQFIRNMFEWDNVFSLEERKPIYARTTTGIEFRCSYLLSGMSLERLGGNLISHNVKKLTGALDYERPRHSKTFLTDDEINYCINDVKVVTAYIAERMEIDGNITTIPFTKTGYVRRATRAACFGTDHKQKQFKDYRRFINQLSMDVEEYKIAKAAFMGGFTHANGFHVNKTMYNVRSYDFTSSYPFVMLAYKYPMTKGIKTEIPYEDLIRDLNNYAWFIKIAFKGLHSKIIYDHYLSKSHCEIEGRHEIDNGRIVFADYLVTTITNIDLEIIKSCYEWDDCRIIDAYKYKLEYLPTPIIKSLLSFYSDKTKLKGIEGREADYMTAKENTNSNYGMMVTDPLRDVITYNGEWGTEKVEIKKALETYNKNRQRFLFYPWGVFVTAYARRNLWTGIHEFKNDYIYSDTDSIKVLNADQHKAYFDRYNDLAVRLMQAAMNHHNLPFEMCNPSDINGKNHLLGVWDDEGLYTRFKTLGAKRYMTEKDGEISLTVSGLNKKKAVPYLVEKYGKENVFDAFTYDPVTLEGITVPPEHTGRITARYIDFETEGMITDYNGVPCRYNEKSSLHMEKGIYSMSIGVQYAQYLLGMREDERW